MELKEVEPIVKGMTTIIHLNMTKYYLLKQQGEIVWPGNAIDGKKIFCETRTGKNKAERATNNIKKYWYLEGENTPEFKTVEEFITHYKTPNQ